MSIIFNRNLLLAFSMLSLLSSAALAANDVAVKEIESAGLLEHISTLASDEFGGRAPMSEGERLTLSYLEKQFKEMGLKPMFGDSYRQSVPLVSITADPDMALSVSDMEGNVHSYAYGTEVMLGSPWFWKKTGSIEANWYGSATASLRLNITGMTMKVST